MTCALIRGGNSLVSRLKIVMRPALLALALVAAGRPAEAELADDDVRRRRSGCARDHAEHG